MAHSTRTHALFLGLLLVASCMQFACSKSTDTSDNGPIVVEAWVKEHKPAVDTLRAQLSAAAAMVKDLPAATVRSADPAMPIRPITKSWGDGENMVILNGSSVRGLPEYGRDEGKSLEGGETSISIAYTGYVDLESAFSMVDNGESRYIKTTREGVGLAKRIAMIRYAILARELRFQPGTLDVASRTFTPGNYEGVAHIIDLQGPTLLGSVTFAAANTGSFESYEGSEAYMLRADLQQAAMRAFRAELGVLFPEIEMPEAPAKENR